MNHLGTFIFKSVFDCRFVVGAETDGLVRSSTAGNTQSQLLTMMDEVQLKAQALERYLLWNRSCENQSDTWLGQLGEEPM
ncbi:hypothetical protein SRHO_G00013570 [Serrasalmus rhombeus]